MTKNEKSTEKRVGAFYLFFGCLVGVSVSQAASSDTSWLKGIQEAAPTVTADVLSEKNFQKQVLTSNMGKDTFGLLEKTGKEGKTNIRAMAEFDKDAKKLGLPETTSSRILAMDFIVKGDLQVPENLKVSNKAGQSLIPLLVQRQGVKLRNSTTAEFGAQLWATVRAALEIETTDFESLKKIFRGDNTGTTRLAQVDAESKALATFYVWSKLMDHAQTVEAFYGTISGNLKYRTAASAKGFLTKVDDILSKEGASYAAYWTKKTEKKEEPATPKAEEPKDVTPKEEQKPAEKSKEESKPAVETPKEESKPAVETPKGESKPAVETPKGEPKPAAETPKAEEPKPAVETPKGESKPAEKPKGESKPAAETPKAEEPKPAVETPKGEPKPAEKPKEEPKEVKTAEVPTVADLVRQFAAPIPFKGHTYAASTGKKNICLTVDDRVPVGHPEWGETSVDVAFAAYEDRLYLTYTDKKDPFIYVISSKDGVTWTERSRISNWLTQEAVRLLSYKGKLHLAHKGTNGSIYVASATRGGEELVWEVPRPAGGPGQEITPALQAYLQSLT